VRGCRPDGRAIAVGGETDLDACSRQSSSAAAPWSSRALIIMLREGEELVVGATAAVAGGLTPTFKLRIPAKDASEQVLLGRFTEADLAQ